MALKEDATVCSVCFFFFVSPAFFGSTDGKGVTHRTSV